MLYIGNQNEIDVQAVIQFEVDEYNIHVCKLRS